MCVCACACVRVHVCVVCGCVYVPASMCHKGRGDVSMVKIKHFQGFLKHVVDRHLAQCPLSSLLMPSCVFVKVQGAPRLSLVPLHALIFETFPC